MLLERLLAACPHLTVLATSRARLLLPFEQAFPVPGLSVAPTPSGRADAVELFLRRAAAGGAAVPDHDLDRVVALCRGLDGMALAIELAAARLPSLGLDGLESGLADRLVLLTGGSRLDDRHRSLRSALDWSYALLDEPDRALLRRLSVFAGAFAAASAAEVLGGLGAGATSSSCRRSWPGWSTRACWSRPPPRAGPATACSRRSVSTARRSSRTPARPRMLHARHLAWILDAARRMLPPVMDGPEGDAWRADFDVLSAEARVGPAPGAVRGGPAGPGVPGVAAARRAELRPRPPRRGPAALRARRGAGARRRREDGGPAPGRRCGRGAAVRQRGAAPARAGRRVGPAGR